MKELFSNLDERYADPESNDQGFRPCKTCNIPASVNQGAQHPKLCWYKQHKSHEQTIEASDHELHANISSLHTYCGALLNGLFCTD